MTKKTLPFDYAFMIMRDNPLKYTLSHGCLNTCMHLNSEKDTIFCSYNVYKETFAWITKNILRFDYAFMVMHNNSLWYTILYSCLKTCIHLNNEKDTIPLLYPQPIFLSEFVFFVTKKSDVFRMKYIALYKRWTEMSYLIWAYRESHFQLESLNWGSTIRPSSIEKKKGTKKLYRKVAWST